MNRKTSVTVIGAGVSGLTVAFWLRRWGYDVTVLEKELYPGGTMRTIREDGWLIESGPNSALETTPLFGTMFEALGLIDEREYADPASNRRYILRSGELHPLPMGPGPFISSRLFTTRGKVRLFKEPFVGRAEREESIAEFVERRLGREFLDYAINPFVAGVYAGNPEDLSVRAAFPKLYALEEQYGGLIKGMMKGARERKQRQETAKDRARMFSFKSGMQSFPDALGRELAGKLRLGCTVRSIVRGTPADPGFQIDLDSGGKTDRRKSDVVVVSTPAVPAASLLRGLSGALADRLERIYYPPVAEVFFGFRTDQIPRKLDGFGYLIPVRERMNILGTIWSSAIFTNRAPDGFAALTTFVGGSRQPEVLHQDDRELRETVLSDLRSILGVRGDPVKEKIIRWEKAIPQYTLGYQKLYDDIEGLESGHPGLFICSNYRGGISVGDCVMNGEKTARRIQEYLGS
jgi:protoporphyrinogen/coproporphyrinogen III oxidase